MGLFILFLCEDAQLFKLLELASSPTLSLSFTPLFPSSFPFTFLFFHEFYSNQHTFLLPKLRE